MGQGVKLEMVAIPGGTFQMGSPATEKQRSTNEGPQRSVTVKSFFMAKYEVTQTQWKTVAALPKIERDLNAFPSNFGGGNRPVEWVSWHDAVEFCTRLSKKMGREYRLPSEAEWEYACRAGTTTPFHFGETITTDLANYQGTDLEYQGRTYLGSYGSGPKGQYRGQTIEVGSFPVNAFGLYDMHGNVYEWCLDYWHENYQGAPIDGSAWIERDGARDAARLLRGGSWGNYPWDCRSAARRWYPADYRNYDISFRVVCSAPRTS
nr:formylglycine-generating enzyme family protein [Leptolyngbya sp. FACHB-36]